RSITATSYFIEPYIISPSLALSQHILPKPYHNREEKKNSIMEKEMQWTRSTLDNASNQQMSNEEESAEGIVITISENIQQNYVPNCYNLVGKIIANKEINFKSAKFALLGIWGNPNGISILEAGRKKIIASFKEEGRGIQILKNSPWCIKGYRSGHNMNLYLRWN
ncbi:hypothetical protein PIB30_069016, partial [Stylosanthes scabra]|nr:hypothetical protein [Stylosanthes scabra]